MLNVVIVYLTPAVPKKLKAGTTDELSFVRLTNTSNKIFESFVAPLLMNDVLRGKSEHPGRKQ